MLRTAKITEVKTFIVNTSYKWLLILEGGKQVIFKVELEHPSDHKRACNIGFEGPKYEVAAFHLYRIAGSRNAPFAAGRIINIRDEIYPLAPQAVKNSIEVHDNGTVCIIHECIRCGKRHICFHDGHARGAVIYWLNKPLQLIKGLFNIYHPFHQLSRGNRRFTKYGFNDRRHCEYARTIPPYNEPTHFLDMVDLSILNFVMANFDEKYLKIAGESSEFVLHIDHGRGYCFTDAAFMNVSLAILYQCCSIRLRLLQQIHRIDDAIRTNTFNPLTRHDVLFPLLTPLQLKRTRDRITDVMDHVKRCQHELSPALVILTNDSML